MIRKCGWAALTALLLAVLSFCALADTEAADLTKKCRFETEVNSKKLAYMHNNNYRNYWDGGHNGEIRVTCPRHQFAQGVMLTFFKDPVPVRFEDDAGRVVAEYDQRYATDWIPFSEPVEAFTIRRVNAEDELHLSNIHVMGEGKLPGWIQRWDTLTEDADLMLVVTHADDEILWFGGMIPTYAGQRGYKVMVVYMVGGNNGMRTAEILDGLWLMGVRWYPDIGKLPDTSGTSMESAYMNWDGEDTAPRRITAAIRRYRPKVVVTHDLEGEYGHYHHVVTSLAAIDAVTRHSADETYDAESAAEYGPWQPLKLYVHLWDQDQTKFNWREPLSAFGGRTGLDVAREAYKKHVSQQSTRYHVKDSGRLDCSLFGLYYSAVGPDEAHNDLFEHIN